MTAKRRHNAGAGSGSWIVYFNDKKPISYGYLKTARQKALENANATGRSVQIYASQGRKAYTVSPKKGNPCHGLTSKPRKVRVRVNGRIHPAVAKKVNGRVKIFVTPKVAAKINPLSERTRAMIAAQSERLKDQRKGEEDRAYTRYLQEFVRKAARPRKRNRR